MQITIDSPEEKKLRQELEKRHDPEAERMKRFLSMPDLSRTPDSPIHEIVKRVLDQQNFKDFDTVKSPEIVPLDICFDIYNFPKDHPARSKSDTYFVDDKNILRPHTTVMWYYYLQQPEIKKRMTNNETLGFFSFGKVYRKDEIDRRHMNVFHQIDGGYLIPKEKRIITIDDLREVLTYIAQAVFGPAIECRFNQDSFPYTDPSLEMEVKIGDRWIEVLGCGIMTDPVLRNLGVNPTKWSNWAFGFGLERLAIISMDLPDIRLLWSQDPRVKKQLKLGNKFKEVSKYPAITRDISFIVNKDFVPNNYFDLIRDIGSPLGETGGELVEEVQLLDKYEDDAKFGKDKISYTYRIIYRSNERTLQTSEIEPLQSKIQEETIKQFGAEIR